MSVVPSSSRGVRMRVRYRPVGTAVGDSEAGSLAFIRSERAGLPRASVELGHRSMQLYYKQSFRPNHGASVGALGTNTALNDLMLQYSKAGVLTTRGAARTAHPAGMGARSQMDFKAIHKSQRHFVMQGMTNNTTMNGMKHFKNQSLNY